MQEELPARSPGGRDVIVRAVRRGDLLRDVYDGSGQLLGLLMVISVQVAAWGVSRLRTGWTVGVISVDEEPWAGQRVLHRESLSAVDPLPRLEELKRQIEGGQLEIPQARDWLLRRRPPKA